MKNFLLSLILITLTFPAWADDAKESAFDRIMRTGVIRCGYYVFPPVTYRDPNTNEMSGFSVDFMNRLAERAALKVEWTEEFTFGNWVPAMQSKRFDAICTPMWPALPHAKAVLFTHSLFFAGMYPVVLADDQRFKNITSLEQLNTQEFRFVLQEGNATTQIIQNAVPNSTKVILPPETETGTYYQQLVSGKADAMISDISSVYEYNKKNPDRKIKALLTEKPVKLQSFLLVTEGNEHRLRDFLDLAIDEMQYDGTIDHILQKWESEPGKTFLRVAPPVKAN